MKDELGARRAAILDFPWEVLEYLSWLRRNAASRDHTEGYLFERPKLRFEAAPEDIIVCEPGLAVQEVGTELALVSPRAPGGVTLQRFRRDQRPGIEKLLSAFDGARTLAEVRLLWAPERALLDSLLEQAFGKMIFAPLAVAAAERQISGVEVTRFPGSPYEIGRAYWINMGSVRAHWAELESALADTQAFVACLRELHVVALMGEQLDNYYQPESPISAGRAAPGRLMHTPTRLTGNPSEPLVLSGPIVHAAQVGGARYHELLYESLGAESPPYAEARGLDWGRVVEARVPGSTAANAKFCPPRPLTPGHFEELREALALARANANERRGPACIAALARFHRAFIRLHPFHCGNQSLAMNLVNRVLGELLGAGVPHLMLDHLALRLSPQAYERAFGRCVAIYGHARPSTAVRYHELASSRTRTFDLLRGIEAARSLEHAGELVARHELAARELLLRD